MAVKQLESAVSLYLKKTSSAHSPKDIIAVRESGSMSTVHKMERDMHYYTLLFLFSDDSMGHGEAIW